MRNENYLLLQIIIEEKIQDNRQPVTEEGTPCCKIYASGTAIPPMLPPRSPSTYHNFFNQNVTIK